MAEAKVTPAGIKNFQILDPSEAPPAKPKAMVISAKMQLWARIKGIDLGNTSSIHLSYQQAKKELGLANVSYIRLMAENALALATHSSRRKYQRHDV